MAIVTIVETVDREYMILVNGVQWGGDRDLSGAGNATFSTRAAAVGAYQDCGHPLACVMCEDTATTAADNGDPICDACEELQ